MATIVDADAMADKLFPRISEVSELRVCRANMDSWSAIARRSVNAAPLLDHALAIFLAEKVSGAPISASRSRFPRRIAAISA